MTRTAYADPEDDIPDEEGSPDVWFSGYLTGIDEALTNVHEALGQFAPRFSSGDPILEQVAICQVIETLVKR